MTYRLQDVFTAIADPHRRQMLDYLAAEELSAGDIAERFAMSRPAVVRHLRVLERSDLVRITKRGRRRLHCLNPAPLRTVRDWLSAYDRFWDDRLNALKDVVEAAADDAEPDGRKKT